MAAKVKPKGSATNKRISQASRIIKAPRQAVYRAFIDPELLARWLAPDTMQAYVHELHPREGGKIRMTLRYVDSDHENTGKTSAQEDSFHGTFSELIPNERIVEIIEFESQDPQFAGSMTMTVTLSDKEDGTEVHLFFQDLPEGIKTEDNDKGSEQSLRKLASLLERI